MKNTHTERTSGVELTKYTEETDHHLELVVFEFASDRSDPVDIRVTQPIPEELDSDHIGFHRDHGTDEWRLQEDELVFENELEGESEHRAVFALRPGAAYDIEELVDVPHEFTVEPAENAVVNLGDGGDFTRSSESSEPAVPAPEHAENGRKDSISTDMNDRTSTPEEDAQSTVAEEPESQHPDGEESLVETFVTELRAGRVSDDHLEYLQQELGTRNAPRRSVDARINQLQREFSDLRAYTNALEQFLDEQGSADEVIDRFETRLGTFWDELESFESTVEEHEAELESFESTVEEHEAELESFESTVEEHETELESLHEGQQELQSEVDSFATDLSSNTDAIEDLSADVAAVDEQLPEYDIESQLSELEDDLDEISEFVNNLRQAFQNQ